MVKVYDSMRTGDVPSNTKESVATLLKCSARTVYLVYPDVQQHADWWIRLWTIALAFAHTLCEGNDPSRMTYSQDSLRSHFLGLSWKEEHYTHHLRVDKVSTARAQSWILNSWSIACVDYLILVIVWFCRPAVQRGEDCGMDSFPGLTVSESMLWSHAEITTLHTWTLPATTT